MKENLFLLIILILTVSLALKRRENFTDSEVTDLKMYTHPDHNETLRNPYQLPGNFFRPSNTFLVPSKTFKDEIDNLDLPANVEDNFSEWIDKSFAPVSSDQMACGGCWAFATTETLSCRLAIATAGKWSQEFPFGLSEQYLISCAGKLGMQQWQGCQGGIPQYAIDATQNGGIPLDQKDLNSRSKTTYYQTNPDENSSCAIAPATTCPCNAIEEKITGPKYQTIGESHTYTAHTEDDNIIHDFNLWPDIPKDIIQKNVNRMKKAIYFEGPITAGIRVTEDFYKFVPTVDNYFKYDGTSKMLGGHAVAIAGWKKLKDGTPVWICKNSWGDNWGYGFPQGPRWDNPISGQNEIKYKGGFWNHIMGINDSFIESNCVGGHPDIKDPDIAKYLPNPELIPSDYYKTMTLRDIYEHHITGKKPDETKKKVLTSFTINDKNLVVNVLDTDSTDLQDIHDFFDNPVSKYLIAGSRDQFDDIIKYLPKYGDIINDETMSELIDNIRDHIKSYVVIGVTGSNSVKFWLIGDVTEWNPFNIGNFIGRTVDPKIIVSLLWEQVKIMQNSKVFFALGQSGIKEKFSNNYSYIKYI